MAGPSAWRGMSFRGTSASRPSASRTLFFLPTCSAACYLVLRPRRQVGRASLYAPQPVRGGSPGTVPGVSPSSRPWTLRSRPPSARAPASPAAPAIPPSAWLPAPPRGRCCVRYLAAGSSARPLLRRYLPAGSSARPLLRPVPACRPLAEPPPRRRGRLPATREGTAAPPGARSPLGEPARAVNFRRGWLVGTE